MSKLNPTNRYKNHRQIINCMSAYDNLIGYIEGIKAAN